MYPNTAVYPSLPPIGTWVCSAAASLLRCSCGLVFQVQLGPMVLVVTVTPGAVGNDGSSVPPGIGGASGSISC